MVGLSKTAGPLTLRRVREDEWAPLRDLRLRALKTDPLAFGSTWDSQVGFPDSYWQDRARTCATSETQAMWVGESPEGRWEGMVVVDRQESNIHLFSMWLAPDWRGQGIGGRLLDSALEWAGRGHPDLPVILEVNPRQEAAVLLYESRGFRRTGRSEPLGHTPGEVIVEMVRPRVGTSR